MQNTLHRVEWVGGSALLFLAMACSSDRSLGEYFDGGSTGATVAVGGSANAGNGSGGTGETTWEVPSTPKPEPTGCEFRNDPFTGTLSYSGTATWGVSATMSVRIVFGQLDQARVTGRVVFGQGVPAYPVYTSEGQASFSTDYWQPGFDYTIMAGVLVGSTLTFKLFETERYCETCAAQTPYPWISPDGFQHGYACLPNVGCAWVTGTESPRLYDCSDPSTGYSARLTASQMDLCEIRTPCCCSADACGSCGFFGDGRNAGPIGQFWESDFTLELAGNTLSGTANQYTLTLVRDP